MNFTKIFGWVLLIAGILIMVWTLYSSYNIFTGKVKLVGIFKIETQKEAPLPQEGEIQDLQTQMKTMLQEQFSKIIPVDIVPKLLNLIIWAILAMILIFGGTQISNLGIKLIKG